MANVAPPPPGLMSRASASPADDLCIVAALDTEYQAAVKGNDAETMDRILADDFVGEDPDGNQLFFNYPNEPQQPKR